MRRAILFAWLLSAACSDPASPDFVDQGIRALLRMREADGAWRSRLYADMKQGPALTSLAVFTLAQMPEEMRRPHSAAIDRSVQWLLQQMNPQGQIGEEYPNFTTAFTLQAVLRLKPPGWESSSKRMAEFLVRSQCIGGWKPEEPGYGGWGLGGGQGGKKELIRLDISTARHMLEALAAAGRVNDVKSAARKFIQACQNDQVTGLDRKDDGGFCYSRANPHQNKAESERLTKTGFRSYGTATADGLLALRALGDENDAFGVRLARDWLQARFSVDATPGFDHAPASAWVKGLIYYYLYSSAKALHVGGSTIEWRAVTIDKLRAMQAPDGSWISPSAAMKEDEPVVATCFALQAWLWAAKQ